MQSGRAAQLTEMVAHGRRQHAQIRQNRREARPGEIFADGQPRIGREGSGSGGYDDDDVDAPPHLQRDDSASADSAVVNSGSITSDEGSAQHSRESSNVESQQPQRVPAAGRRRGSDANNINSSNGGSAVAHDRRAVPSIISPLPGVIIPDTAAALRGPGGLRDASNSGAGLDRSDSDLVAARNAAAAAAPVAGRRRSQIAGGAAASAAAAASSATANGSAVGSGAGAALISSLPKRTSYDKLDMLAALSGTTHPFERSGKGEGLGTDSPAKKGMSFARQPGLGGDASLLAVPAAQQRRRAASFGTGASAASAAAATSGGGVSAFSVSATSHPFARRDSPSAAAAAVADVAAAPRSPTFPRMVGAFGSSNVGGGSGGLVDIWPATSTMTDATAKSGGAAGDDGAAPDARARHSTGAHFMNYQSDPVRGRRESIVSAGSIDCINRADGSSNSNSDDDDDEDRVDNMPLVQLPHMADMIPEGGHGGAGGGAATGNYDLLSSSTSTGTPGALDASLRSGTTTTSSSSDSKSKKLLKRQQEQQLLATMDFSGRDREDGGAAAAAAASGGAAFPIAAPPSPGIGREHQQLAQDDDALPLHLGKSSAEHAAAAASAGQVPDDDDDDDNNNGGCCAALFDDTTKRTGPARVVPVCTSYMDRAERKRGGSGGGNGEPIPLFQSNHVFTNKYSVYPWRLKFFLYKMLWEQFHRKANLYFLLIGSLQLVPGLSPFGRFTTIMTLAVVLAFSFIKLGVEDYMRYRRDVETNNRKAFVLKSFADREWREVTYGDIEVGDLVRVDNAEDAEGRRNNEIPCDMVLLTSSEAEGVCYVETANLDGETNLKQKRALASTAQTLDVGYRASAIAAAYRGMKVRAEHPNGSLYTFSASIELPEDRDMIVLQRRGRLHGGADGGGGGGNSDAFFGSFGSSGGGYSFASNTSPQTPEAHGAAIVPLPHSHHHASSSAAASAIAAGPFSGNFSFGADADNNNSLSSVGSGGGSGGGAIVGNNSGIMALPAALRQSPQATSVDAPPPPGAAADVEFGHVISSRSSASSGGTAAPAPAQPGSGAASGAVGAATATTTGTTATSGVHESLVRPVSLQQALYRGCSLRKAFWAVGVCVATGHETKIMKNSRSPPSKASRVERMVNTLLLAVLGLQLALCVSCAIAMAFHPNEAWYVPDDAGYDHTAASALSFLTFLLLFSNFIPISLYVSIEFIKFFQGRLMEQDLCMYYPPKDMPAVAKTTDLNEELGQINFVFTDKTGTLTRNVMALLKFAVNGMIYGEGTTEIGRVAAARKGVKLEDPRPHSVIHGPDPFWDRRLGDKWFLDKNVDYIKELFFCLGVCHTVVVDGKKLEAESPDDEALVKGAARFDFELVERTLDGVNLQAKNGGATFVSVLETVGFNSDRKRSSVVIRHPLTDDYVLITKGADSVMLPRLAAGQPRRSTKAILGRFGEEGLRTLVVCARELDTSEAIQWLSKMRAAREMVGMDKERAERIDALAEEIERDYRLVGITGVEDKLQDRVSETISAMAKAGINVWMLTGDKRETAINIGFACSLLHGDMEVVQMHSMKVGRDEPKLREKLLSAIGRVRKYRLDRQNPPPLQQQSPPGAKPVSPGAQTSSTKKNGGGSGAADATATGDQEMHPLEKSTNTAAPPSPATKYRTVSNSSSTPAEFACVIDGGTLALALSSAELRQLFYDFVQHCSSVICCRVSPRQKSDVVLLVRELSNDAVTTLAIGDGANDVPMIQAAHVGVGISGMEGQQAANSADYAIGQFKFLHRLVMVHGRSSYYRISMVIKYSFYKNALLVMTLFFYCLFNRFTGQALYEQWSFASYNVVFTAFPIIVVGIFDREILQTDRIHEHPQLYRSGLENVHLTVPIIVFWLCLAVFQGAVIFFGVVYAAGDAIGKAGWPLSLDGCGVAAYCAVVIVATFQLFLMINSFSNLHYLSFGGSLLSLFVFLGVYAALPPSVSTTLYHSMQNISFEQLVWVLAVVSVVVCLLPTILIKYYLKNFVPVRELPLTDLVQLADQTVPNAAVAPPVELTMHDYSIGDIDDAYRLTDADKFRHQNLTFLLSGTSGGGGKGGGFTPFVASSTAAGGGKRPSSKQDSGGGGGVTAGMVDDRQDFLLRFRDGEVEDAFLVVYLGDLLRYRVGFAVCSVFAVLIAVYYAAVADASTVELAGWAIFALASLVGFVILQCFPDARTQLNELMVLLMVLSFSGVSIANLVATDGSLRHNKQLLKTLIASAANANASSVSATQNLDPQTHPVTVGVIMLGLLVLVRPPLTQAINYLIIIVCVFFLWSLIWIEQRDMFGVREESIRALELLIVGATAVIGLAVTESFYRKMFISSLAVTQALQRAKNEQRRSMLLLQNVMPAAIVADLRGKTLGQFSLSFEKASVVTSDIVQFTNFSSGREAHVVVEMLNILFVMWDSHANELQLEKIKTTGDAYLCASGIPNIDSDHAKKIVIMGLWMLRSVALVNREGTPSIRKLDINIRVGGATGLVRAGVVGRQKLCYDIFGPAVAEATEMETGSLPGRMRCSQALYEETMDVFSYDIGIDDETGELSGYYFAVDDRQDKQWRVAAGIDKEAAAAASAIGPDGKPTAAAAVVKKHVRRRRAAYRAKDKREDQYAFLTRERSAAAAAGSRGKSPTQKLIEGGGGGGATPPATPTRQQHQQRSAAAAGEQTFLEIYKMDDGNLSSCTLNFESDIIEDDFRDYLSLLADSRTLFERAQVATLFVLCALLIALQVRNALDFLAVLVFAVGVVVALAVAVRYVDVAELHDQFERTGGLERIIHKNDVVAPEDVVAAAASGADHDAAASGGVDGGGGGGGAGGGARGSGAVVGASRDNSDDIDGARSSRRSRKGHARTRSGEADPLAASRGSISAGVSAGVSAAQSRRQSDASGASSSQTHSLPHVAGDDQLPLSKRNSMSSSTRSGGRSNLRRGGSGFGGGSTSAPSTAEVSLEAAQVPHAAEQQPQHTTGMQSFHSIDDLDHHNNQNSNGNSDTHVQRQQRQSSGVGLSRSDSDRSSGGDAASNPAGSGALNRGESGVVRPAASVSASDLNNTRNSQSSSSGSGGTNTTPHGSGISTNQTGSGSQQCLVNPNAAWVTAQYGEAAKRVQRGEHDDDDDDDDSGGAGRNKHQHALPDGGTDSGQPSPFEPSPLPLPLRRQDKPSNASAAASEAKYRTDGQSASASPDPAAATTNTDAHGHHQPLSAEKRSKSLMRLKAGVVSPNDEQLLKKKQQSDARKRRKMQEEARRIREQMAKIEGGAGGKGGAVATTNNNNNKLGGGGGAGASAADRDALKRLEQARQLEASAQRVREQQVSEGCCHGGGDGDDFWNLHLFLIAVAGVTAIIALAIPLLYLAVVDDPDTTTVSVFLCLATIVNVVGTVRLRLWHKVLVASVHCCAYLGLFFWRGSRRGDFSATKEGGNLVAVVLSYVLSIYAGYSTEQTVRESFATAMRVRIENNQVQAAVSLCDRLLKNVLPRSIIERMRKDPAKRIVDDVEDASVLFLYIDGLKPDDVRLLADVQAAAAAAAAGKNGEPHQEQQQQLHSSSSGPSSTSPSHDGLGLFQVIAEDKTQHLHQSQLHHSQNDRRSPTSRRDSVSNPLFGASSTSVSSNLRLGASTSTAPPTPAHNNNSNSSSTAAGVVEDSDEAFILGVAPQQQQPPPPSLMRAATIGAFDPVLHNSSNDGSGNPAGDALASSFWAERPTIVQDDDDDADNAARRAPPPPPPSHAGASNNSTQQALTSVDAPASSASTAQQQPQQQPTTTSAAADQLLQPPRRPPSTQVLVHEMNDFVFVVDLLCDYYRVEKIKTVPYLVASGCPEPSPLHFLRLACLARDVVAFAQRFSARTGRYIAVKAGLQTGRVAAAVLGSIKFIYDVFGDTVNTASRFASVAKNGQVICSTQAAERLAPYVDVHDRGTTFLKGKGDVRIHEIAVNGGGGGTNNSEVDAFMRLVPPPPFVYDEAMTTLDAADFIADSPDPLAHLLAMDDDDEGGNNNLLSSDDDDGDDGDNTARLLHKYEGRMSICSASSTAPGSPNQLSRVGSFLHSNNNATTPLGSPVGAAAPLSAAVLRAQLNRRAAAAGSKDGDVDDADELAELNAKDDDAGGGGGGDTRSNASTGSRRSTASGAGGGGSPYAGGLRRNRSSTMTGSPNLSQFGLSHINRMKDGKDGAAAAAGGAPASLAPPAVGAAGLAMPSPDIDDDDIIMQLGGADHSILPHALQSGSPSAAAAAASTFSATAQKSDDTAGTPRVIDPFHHGGTVARSSLDMESSSGGDKSSKTDASSCTSFGGSNSVEERSNALPPHFSGPLQGRFSSSGESGSSGGGSSSSSKLGTLAGVVGAHASPSQSPQQVRDRIPPVGGSNYDTLASASVDSGRPLSDSGVLDSGRLLEVDGNNNSSSGVMSTLRAGAATSPASGGWKDASTGGGWDKFT